MSEAGFIEVRDELNWPLLAKYLRARLEVDGPMSVRQFLGGSANLTFRVTFGEQRFVVRRPPFGPVARGAHDMRRESTVLSGLGQCWEKVPRCRLFCDDHSVIGADFLVMDYLEGVVVRDEGIPAAMRHHAQAGRRVGLALASATAELHRIDVARCGLQDLGNPEDFAQRQVEGWWRRWQGVSPGGATEALMADAYERLRAAIPRPASVGIVHGDLKLNNCMFDPGDPDSVLAILDWDMATLGDPLFDIGTLLVLWPEPGPLGQASAAMTPELADIGLPSRAEVLDRYAAVSGAALDHVGWYLAFAAWKATVIIQQLSARYERGASSDARLAQLSKQVPVLASVIEPSFDV